MWKGVRIGSEGRNEISHMISNSLYNDTWELNFVGSNTEKPNDNSRKRIDPKCVLYTVMFSFNGWSPIFLF